MKKGNSFTEMLKRNSFVGYSARMVERTLLGRFQKTSLIALIGFAAATMMITVSVIGAIQLQQASAVQPTYCYNTSLFEQAFCGTKKECRASQESNPTATSGCYKQP